MGVFSHPIVQAVRCYPVMVKTNRNKQGIVISEYGVEKGAPSRGGFGDREPSGKELQEQAYGEMFSLLGREAAPWCFEQLVIDCETETHIGKGFGSARFNIEVCKSLS